MIIQALYWKEEALELLDQTLLPERASWLCLERAEDVFEAIQSLRVRGAPAIGIAAAYGLYLAVRNQPGASREQFFSAVDEAVAYLASARPTAVNLFWALDEIRARVARERQMPVEGLKRRLLELAKELHEDDRQRCDKMAAHGLELIPERARILTHCNTGALATGGVGTAFGVIHEAHRQGRKIRVFADETRPVLQGARLTAYELAAAGIPYEIICDSAAGSLMAQRRVDLVILGADRIAADGSTANKIGTYSLAVLAKYHGIPFYVAAPFSTFDLNLSNGAMIPIETRGEDEIRRVLNRTLITMSDAPCFNPAFDVTPPELITAFVTERGILRPPFEAAIRERNDS